MGYKETPRYFAGVAWANLNRRVRTAKAYAHVEVRMEREEFVAWYVSALFPGCSVDRIDNQGHYELTNLQMLTRSQNSAKQGKNFLAPEGKHWCSVCKRFLSYKRFHKSKNGYHGLHDRCKKCRDAQETRIGAHNRK